MSWCNELIIDWAQVKEAVLSAAALATVAIAWRGLGKWQSELRGKAHFETARNLARCVFKVRDAIQSCRVPLILSEEFEGLDPQSPSGSIRGDAYAKVYSKRYAPLAAAVRELESASLEAEALWGSESRAKVDALRQCAATLRGAIDAFISNAASLDRDFGSDKVFGKRMREIVFGVPSDEDNPLNQQLAKAVTAIETFLRPHLRR